MDHKQLDIFKEWFAAYCRGFYADNEADNRNFCLKETHTHHVCENMRMLADGLDLTPEERSVAEAIALFHDVGRFEQYRRYATFRDDISENHAALGVQVLRSEGILSEIPEGEAKTILQAVSLHNVFLIPPSLCGRDLMFVRLIRDADKLDIWRIFEEYYTKPEEERASAVGLGFPDLPQCTPEVLECIDRGEMVNLKMLKSLNDFKLLQLSWVFDLGFTDSYRLLLERNHIDGIARTLPENGEVTEAVRLIRNFAAHRATGGETDV